MRNALHQQGNELDVIAPADSVEHGHPRGAAHRLRLAAGGGLE
jgi:hypothetical protein